MKLDSQLTQITNMLKQMYQKKSPRRLKRGDPVSSAFPYVNTNLIVSNSCLSQS